MPLARKVYRRCKVWAEVDETGRLVENHGLVKIRYRQEDAASYSAKARDLAEVPPQSLVAPSSASADSGGEAASIDSGSKESGTKPSAKKPRAPRKPRVKKATGDAVDPAGVAGASDVLIVYADGSCFGNPGPAGLGVLLEWRGQVKEVSRFLGEGTNNIAELTAIEVALESVKNKAVPVRIHTDSAYSIGVLSQGWKVKANQELVARIQLRMRDFPDLVFVKVRGHAGDPRNERVDQLARDSITRRA